MEWLTWDWNPTDLPQISHRLDPKFGFCDWCPAQGTWVPITWIQEAAPQTRQALDACMIVATSST